MSVLSLGSQGALVPHTYPMEIIGGLLAGAFIGALTTFELERDEVTGQWIIRNV